MYQERNVATVIILSIVTCGIYMFYWLYVTMKDINSYLEIQDMDPAVELLICIFCSPYILYWMYKYSQRITDVHIKAALETASDDAVICLILAVFGLGIISVAIMQNSLNKAWTTGQSVGY